MFELVMLTGFLIAALSQFLPAQAGYPHTPARPGKRKCQGEVHGSSA